MFCKIYLEHNLVEKIYLTIIWKKKFILGHVKNKDYLKKSRKKYLVYKICIERIY